jgi:hypothetical protein
MGLSIRGSPAQVSFSYPLLPPSVTASSPAPVSRPANFPLHFTVIWRRKEGCEALSGWETGTWLPLTREEQRHEH